MTIIQKPTSYVGFEIIKNEDIIKISQIEYIKRILKQNDMENSKPVKIPIQQVEQTKTTRRNKNYPYREIIGSLLYLSTKTRPDIAYGVNFCSRYVEEPSQERITDIKHILKYLNGNKEHGIEYKNNKEKNLLKAYCDADFAGDPETRRSTTGYVILYAGGAISWCSRKQSVIALSSTEAEYIAAAECCKELLYLKTLFEELLNYEIKIELNVDNQSAIALIKNGILNKRSKHIDVKFRFIHELVRENIIKIKYCPTNEQLADIFTKPLNTVKFVKFKEQLLCN